MYQPYTNSKVNKLLTLAVVQTSKNIQDIYNSVPHCLVAISRHRRSFTFYTPARDDTLGTKTKQTNSRFDQELFTIYQRTN